MTKGVVKYYLISLFKDTANCLLAVLAYFFILYVFIWGLEHVSHLLFNTPLFF